MRDSFIFYRSFFEAIKPLPESDRVKIYDAICDYSLNNKETDFEGIVLGFFTLIKPQLEANNKRFENGSKPKEKQKGSKSEAKAKQVISKAEANNNVNDNVNINNNTPVLGLVGFSAFWQQYPKKKSKGDAERAWKKIKPSSELLNKIMESLQTEKNTSQWKKEGGQFIPYPASWLNSKGWENESDKIESTSQEPYQWVEGERDAMFTMEKEEFKIWKDNQLLKMKKGL